VSEIPNEAEEPLVASRWSRLVSRFLENRSAAAGGAILALLIVCAAGATLIAPHDPLAINPVMRLRPPGLQHWFGTDEVGRDLFSRIVYGSRYFLLIAWSRRRFRQPRGRCLDSSRAPVPRLPTGSSCGSWT
jgi:ABC-type dipeptide/oligopeptide/nickel transport system permease subunit